MLEKEIGKDVQIDPTARINVSEKLVIGDRSVIGRMAHIEGRSIVIGKEAWIDEYAHIGGGSCFEKHSSLVAGDFLHMGKFSHVNTARAVTIGSEVGIGINTKIFTHGAYLSAYEGFPYKFESVSIGDRVWLPNAWVNPGVKIGDDVVVAALSLVNEDIPSGALAGGIPARIIRRNNFPKTINMKEKQEILDSINFALNTYYELKNHEIEVNTPNGKTCFDLDKRSIVGAVTNQSEMLKNQLRRIGVRFRFYAKDGRYESW